VTPENDDAGHEDRLNDVLLEYVEARESGSDPDRDQLIAAYPELETDLLAFFASHDQIERLAAPLRETNLKAARIDDAHQIPSADTQQPELGQLGDFRLIREVGRGGMGVVYEAEQLTLRRQVALKILPFAAAINPRQLQRFKNEAAAAAHLRHENIVPVHAVGCERGVHYYAMQFIDGQSLAAVISELRNRKLKSPSQTPEGGNLELTTVPLAWMATEKCTDDRGYFEWVARLGRQVALALEYAHQTGIIHRDIKPGNLLLDARGQIWITDFGLAHVLGDGGLTATGELLGTLRYASPEQALGRRGIVDHRHDIYSLGSTLYELLTLRPPFEGRDRHELLHQIASEEPAPPRSIVPAIPLGLETIILKAIRKEPADRYASAQELADDLQRFLEHRPILARPPGFVERFRMWSRRHPTSIIVGMSVLLMVTIGSITSAALLRGEQERTKAEQQKAEAAYERERQRAEEAETRLILARRAVNELVQVSEEELAERPGMEALRKRLLRSALAYYQEILDERRDDPEAQAEILDATHRVEKILADLTVLKAATYFYLLCQAPVLDDLRLAPEQRVKTRDLTSLVGRQWSESFRDIGLVSPNERSHRTLEQARANEASLNAILTPVQQARLRQIGLQSEGPYAFHDPEVSAVLGLTVEQRDRIRMIEDDAAFGWMRAMTRGTSGGEINHAAEARELSVNERILAVLTQPQLQKWKDMTGTPVKGSIKPFTTVPFIQKKEPKR
jgi:serine/threonine protein kinase